MTEQKAKPFEERTMSELDAISAEACSKVIAESSAKGVPVVYGDAEKTYREWPDGRIEFIHDYIRPRTKS